MFNFFRKKVEYEPDSDFYKINLLFEELKQKGSLPIRLSDEVVKSLLEIANTKDWHKSLDNQTINQIIHIYERWQRNINNTSSDKIVSTSAGGGFEQREYWEGTLEEYHIAKSKGIIKDNTDVRIVTYSNTHYIINEDGSIEEYMN